MHYRHLRPHSQPVLLWPLRPHELPSAWRREISRDQHLLRYGGPCRRPHLLPPYACTALPCPEIHILQANII